MKVRSWYGVTGEVEVEDELWHLVRVGRLPLGHPPLVNLVLRRRLARDDRLRLSRLHEIGHLETLPLALAHALALLRAASGRRRPLAARLGRLVALVVAHQAVWELVSEAYVMTREGPAYWETYRKSSDPLGLVALALLGGAGLVLSLRLARTR